jgi:hypothetical protein
MKSLKKLLTKIILNDTFIKLFVYLSAFVLTILLSIEL